MITRQIKDEVVKYDSFNPYIDGIFYRTTHKIGNVEVEHFKRAVGTSNYTLKKLIKLWLAYWNYSVIPLRISSVLGGVSAAGGFLAAIMIAIRKLINPTVMVGWSSTICAIVVFFRIDSDGARHHRRIPRKDDSDSEPHAAVYCAGNH